MEKVPGGLGQLIPNLLQASVVDSLAHCAGADDLPICLDTGHLHALDAHLGQLLGHNLVIKAGDQAAGFLPYVAHAHPKSLGNGAKQREVQLSMAGDHRLLVFQKVAGEGG